MSECKRCGQCCMDNGLIPPVLPDDPDAPAWLIVLVASLLKHFADVAEEYPCVFLTNDLSCAIHDVAKPGICRAHVCKIQ